MVHPNPRLSAHHHHSITKATAAASSDLPFFFGISIYAVLTYQNSLKFIIPKKVTNYRFLPVDKFKSFSCPFAFCMWKIFYENDSAIDFLLIIVRIGFHKFFGVYLQFIGLPTFSDFCSKNCLSDNIILLTIW